MTETSTPARYIDADTYTGTWTVSGSRKSDQYRAGELAEMFGTEVFVVWEFAGHVRGRALYARTRFVAQPDGSLAGYNSEGTIVIVHPADRVLRIATA